MTQHRIRGAPLGLGLSTRCEKRSLARGASGNTGVGRQDGAVVDLSSALALLRAPYIFSQRGPVRTSQLISDARRLGLPLNAQRLRQLHEAGDLSPLAALTDVVVEVAAPPTNEPPPSSTSLIDLRAAQETGRIYDPTQTPAPGDEPLRFDERRATDPPAWWNGLLYSRWQLLNARRLSRIALPATGLDPSRDPTSNEQGSRERAVALTVTLLEARYLPEVQPGWNRLRGVGDEEWFAWRAAYDTTQQLENLRTIGVALAEVYDFAERLLIQAKSLDPTGRWGSLIGRAPVKKWESTTGDLALALEQRLAAEILLKFYADAGGELPARPAGGSRAWHPLNDRVSDRSEPLGQLLMRLGVSAHPGAILIVEGETERRTAARILDDIGLDDASHIVQIVQTSGVDKSLQILATATIAPLLGERHQDAYDMLRPPCHLLAVVDPEGKYRTPEQVERERLKVVNAIVDVVTTQRDDAEIEHLDSLVELRAWTGGPYEFAHFTDTELLDAITTVHTDPSARPSDAELLAKIVHSRSRGSDLKAVWHDWAHKPSKLELADALWPVLRRKIRAALESGEKLPELAAAVYAAHSRARINSQGSWVIGFRKEAR